MTPARVALCPLLTRVLSGRFHSRFGHGPILRPPGEHHFDFGAHNGDDLDGDEDVLDKSPVSASTKAALAVSPNKVQGVSVRPLSSNDIEQLVSDVGNFVRDLFTDASDLVARQGHYMLAEAARVRGVRGLSEGSKAQLAFALRSTRNLSSLNRSDVVRQLRKGTKRRRAIDFGSDGDSDDGLGARRAKQRRVVTKSSRSTRAAGKSSNTLLAGIKRVSPKAVRHPRTPPKK